MTPFVVLGFFASLLLIGAVKDRHPLAPLVERFGGTAPAWGSTVDYGGGTGAGGGSGAAPVPVPPTGGGTGAPGCQPPPLVTWQGVTLNVPAMRSFQTAQRNAGGRIQVSSSYRSCAQQTAACMNLCGHSSCPDCAPAGKSQHQRGNAIDVHTDTANLDLAIRYLTPLGWCRWDPTGDRGHFAYQVCA